ncbi:UBA/TS-N domain-containing protein [Mucor ambiguus]|uniref:UBA/TS-N domain-containing protein n=1 Tax=Mucor ambiguus TaxID=91626 RepID=A0A0C9LXL0_9FUNG|nr:UBA/TS-N domain-containing protein [Mucor ambiguus]
MDDLLDLSWSAPASSTVKPQPSQQPQKPKDAFADLLSSSTTPKPVDISKLSLVERQKLQQQQQQPSNTSSPWLTPTQATTPLSPSNHTSRYTPPSSSTLEAKQAPSASDTNTSSFENLLDPFGSSKRQTDDRSTPLNQLRTQTSTPVSNGNDWDFDLLDTKLNANASTNNTSTPTSVIDPFDVDSLMHQQQTRSPQVSNTYVAENGDEDDNPLGILARPAIKSPPPTASSPEPAPHVQSLSPVNQEGIMLDEDQEDAMLAQLIEMGFSLQESKFAIEATGGQDLQSAVDLLVQNSETAQRQQPTTATASTRSSQPVSQNERARNTLFAGENDSAPSPSRRSQASQQPRPKQESHDDSLQDTTEKIVTQAQELGGFLYKNATSYFKAGREKVTKAVGDWQEQQRAQRLQHMQEEQNGSVRPKWMQAGDDTLDMSNNTVEKFADDDDSEDEGQKDLETERRKLQEMRRIQEMKQREHAATAHKQRQQQKLRKDALIDDEQETYVSPSRRRGNSGRSTPRSNGSPQLEQQKPSTPSTPKNTRTRPIVNASPDVMAKANEARNQGNEKFKLGQFGESEEAYTRAIDILPGEHDHQVLLYNNRAMARLKIGHYKKCVEDCDFALGLAKRSGEGSTTSEEVVIQWRDQIIKSLSRKAEALENIEKYKDALATYDELLKYESGGNPKVTQGMSRCRQALNPKKKAPSTPKKPATPVAEAKKDDFMSMFDPNAPSNNSTPIVSDAELSKSKAVAAMRAKAAEQEAEDAEKLEKTDDVNAQLVAWKAGKEQNLRALLATLDTLLWPGAQWKGAQMSELINPKKCKITYMKAISKVHPDKLPSDVTVEQRMLASGIFASLNEAWDSFKNQNQL